MSGTASVFISIGVNNLILFKTHLKDEQKTRIKFGYFIKVMAMVNSKIENQAALNAGNYQHVVYDLTKLKQFMTLMKQLLLEEESLY